MAWEIRDGKDVFVWTPYQAKGIASDLREKSRLVAAEDNGRAATLKARADHIERYGWYHP